jgi:hypothetical protein
MGALYGALSIWLTVRIINRREKWAINTAIAATVGPVAVALLYLLSGEILTQPDLARHLPEWAESACHWLYPNFYGVLD